MRRFAGICLLLPLSACGDYSWSEISAKCPVFMKDAIVANIGPVDSFTVTERNEAARSTEGNATVNGRKLWWQCGKGIATVGKVEVEVREGTRTVYGGSIDEGFTELP
jgi:hypothetical protein